MIRSFTLRPRPRDGATATRPPRLRARRGFTVVETIVAVVLIAMGVLALVSSSSLILRDMSGAAARSRAAARANERFEALRGYNRCSAIHSAVVAAGDMTDTLIGPNAGSTALRVRYVVKYTAARRARADSFVTHIPCWR